MSNKVVIRFDHSNLGLNHVKEGGWRRAKIVLDRIT